jgi:hypothetical protein
MGEAGGQAVPPADARLAKHPCPNTAETPAAAFQAACGGNTIRHRHIETVVASRGRPIANRPQVNNLPHKKSKK